jgi:hypothetical protein
MQPSRFGGGGVCLQPPSLFFSKRIEPPLAGGGGVAGQPLPRLARINPHQSNLCKCFDD